MKLAVCPFSQAGDAPQQINKCIYKYIFCQALITKMPGFSQPFPPRPQARSWIDAAAPQHALSDCPLHTLLVACVLWWLLVGMLSTWVVIGRIL